MNNFENHSNVNIQLDLFYKSANLEQHSNIFI